MPEMSLRTRRQATLRGTFAPLGHEYGPHRPEDAPTTVTVFASPDDREALIPAVLLRQREQLNTRAHLGVTS